MWASTSLRALLAGLLIVSAILFAVGSTLERHQHGKETTAATHQEGSGGESGGESTAHAGTHREKGVTLLGINTESLGLEIAAIVASVLLAAAAWLLRQRLVLLAILAFGLVFAAGDVRELVHQINESHAGIAAIAATLIVLHLVVAGTAAVLLGRRTDGAVVVAHPAT
jgi:uncharacterized oligopeptide transporter (OPT) family protein